MISAIVLLAMSVLFPLFLYPILVSAKQASFSLNQINQSSLLYFILPISLTTFYLVIANYIVFGIAKHNNVDLYNNIRPILRWKIAFAKQLSTIVIGLVFGVILHIILFVVIFMTIDGIQLKHALAFVAVGFAGNIVAFIIFGSIFTSISIYFKSLTALVLNVLIAVISIFGLITPNVISNPNSTSFTYDSSEQKQNYVKIYSFTDDGVVNNIRYAQKTNWDSALNDNGIENADEPAWAKYNPFSFMTAFNGIVWNAEEKSRITDDQIIDLYNRNSRFTVIQPSVSSSPFLNGVAGEIQKGFVVAPIDEQTIFDIDDNQERFEKIAATLNANNNIANSLKDDNKWTLFYNKLYGSSVWLNIGLTDSEKDMLTYIAGLQDRSSIFYDILQNGDHTQNYLIGLDEFLKFKGFGDELIKLINFIWHNPVSSSNLLNKFLDFVDLKHVYAKHPQLYVMDEKEKAIDYDIDYIKNKEFKFEITNGSINAKVLNVEGTYVPLPNFNIVFPNVSTMDDYDHFFDNKTVVELKTLIDKAQLQLSSGGQVEKYDFHENALDIYSLDNWISFSVKQVNYIQISYLVLFIALAFAMNTYAFDRLGRKDLI